MVNYRLNYDNHKNKLWVFQQILKSKYPITNSEMRACKFKNYHLEKVFL